MKKFLFIIAALAAVYFTSCERENFNQEADVPGLPRVIRATMEDNTTKAGFNYDPTGKTYSHFWESGDAFAVIYYDYRNGAVKIDGYQSTDGSGDFENQDNTLTYYYQGLPENDKLFCVYPYDVSIGTWSAEKRTELGYNMELPMFYEFEYDPNCQDNPGLFIYIPSEETYDYDANTLGYGNILAARLDGASELEDVTFRTCMGWLKIQLTGYNYIKSISVSEKNGNKALAGYYYITFDASNNPVLYEDEGDSWEKTININPPYIFPGSSTVPFYFALPPASYDGLSVTITYSDGTATVLETNKEVVIDRNMVTPMASRSTTNLTATLADGKTFCSALKTLAEGSTVAYNVDDYNIKTIDLVTDSEVTSSTVVSAPGSGLPVYAVFDNEDEKGEIKLYTRAPRVSLNENSSCMFFHMRKLTSVGMLPALDCSAVTDMSYMFSCCPQLSSVTMPAGDCPNLENISNMFFPSGAYTYSQFTSFTWDLVGAKVTNASDMFYNNQKLQSVSMPNFTGCSESGDYDASHMFLDCQNLITVDLRNFWSQYFKSNLMFYRNYWMRKLYLNPCLVESEGSYTPTYFRTDQPYSANNPTHERMFEEFAKYSGACDLYFIDANMTEDILNSIKSRFLLSYGANGYGFGITDAGATITYYLAE